MTFLNHIVYKYVILLLLLILLLKWQMLVVQGALCLCACSRLSVNLIERTILTAKEKKVKKNQMAKFIYPSAPVTVTEYVKRDPLL